MPTILRHRGLSVRIYPNDHTPPHVHVVSASGVARIALGEGDDRPRLLTVVGMTRAEAADALRLVAASREICLWRWRQFHGEP
jgi:hypothetical protein